MSQVEQAFKQLKTTLLEIRPIYHKLDWRIKAHVFLCALAYYVQFHAAELLRPLLEGQGKQSARRWSMDMLLERLRAIRMNELSIKGVPAGAKPTKPDAEQARILQLLDVKMM